VDASAPRTIVRSTGDQDATGPTAVADQSIERSNPRNLTRGR
jgi:hypothetical protein